MEEQEFTPQFLNEASIVKQYFPLAKSPEHIFGRDEKGNTSSAWRIILNNEATRTPKAVVVFDWDDTLEPYTERKKKLYSSYLPLVPNLNQDEQAAFMKLCGAFNSEARILPVNGAHPERYAPLLELLATSQAITGINSGDKKLLDGMSGDNPKEVARLFIQQESLPVLNKGVEASKVSIKEEEKGAYFIETKDGPQITSIDFSKRPDSVSESVWELYKASMTRPNIPESEITNFDLPDDIHFVVGTFGEADFQLEKIFETIQVLKERRVRTPDEILLFTKGRKNAIIQALANKFPDAPLVYVDDSPRQVDSLVGIEGITPIHALREGSQRSTEKVSEGIKEVNVSKTPMSQILTEALSPDNP